MKEGKHGLFKDEMRDKALKLVRRDQPTLAIGSPTCSIVMNLNWSKMSPVEKEKRPKEARVHLTFCLELYKIQHQEGRYFLPEHPLSTT